MNKLRTFVLGLSAVVALTVLTACGGSDDKGSSDGGILSGNSSSSSSSGSSGGSSSGSSGSSSSGGSLDFAKAAKNLQDVKSFNFDISLKMNLGDLGSSGSSGSKSNDFDVSGLFAMLGNVKASGSYVAPDQTSVTASLMGQQFNFIQIGNKSWTKQGNGKWTEGSSSSSPLGSFSPADLGSSAGSIPSDALKDAKVTKETVNGIKATKYAFDRKALEALAKSSGGSSSSSADAFKDFDKAEVSIWISDDTQIPVKMAMDLSGKDDKKKDIGLQMEFNLKDINSKSISIKPPV